MITRVLVFFAAVIIFAVLLHFLLLITANAFIIYFVSFLIGFSLVILMIKTLR